jgi:ribosomal protein S6--L-glutamate ligase
MNIGILIYSKPSMESSTGVERLIEAGVELGHKVHKIYEQDLSFVWTNNELEILHQGESLPELDVIISRPNFIEEPGLRLYATEMLKDVGYKIINGDSSFALAKNKLAQHLVFQKENIPCPEFAIARNPEEALNAACKIGFPVIIKVAFGTLGKGVFYAENHETFSPIAEYLAIRDGNPLIIERFVSEADRKDLRVFVVGGKVVASMERNAPQGDVRANTSSGGTGFEVELTDDERELAIRVAKTFNIEICGVDLIRSKKGPLVLEVNANPGFRELERVTGKDIAKEIVEYSLR